MNDRNSIPAAADAVATLVKSSTVRTLVWPVLMSVLSGAAMWFTAKLDTKFEVDSLSDKVETLSGEITVLSSHTKDLAAKIDGLSAKPDASTRSPGGLLYQLDEDIRLAHRNAVKASGEARALSSARNRERQSAGGNRLANAFDNVVKNNARLSYAEAADKALDDVAPDP